MSTTTKNQVLDQVLTWIDEGVDKFDVGGASTQSSMTELFVSYLKRRISAHMDKNEQTQTSTAVQDKQPLEPAKNSSDEESPILRCKYCGNYPNIEKEPYVDRAGEYSGNPPTHIPLGFKASCGCGHTISLPLEFYLDDAIDAWNQAQTQTEKQEKETKEMTMNTVEQVAAKNIIRDLDETRPLFAKILNNLDAARRGAQHLTNEDKDEMEYIKGATLDVYLRIAKYSCTLLADNPDLLKEEEPEQ